MYAILNGCTMERHVEKIGQIQGFREVYCDIQVDGIDSMFDCPVYYEPNLTSAIIASEDPKKVLFLIGKESNRKSVAITYLMNSCSI